MNRILVFELATVRHVTQRDDVLLIGWRYTVKSHLAQALEHDAIQQGHRMLYREAQVLLKRLTVATIDGRRTGVVAELISVPLLIIEDRGMRKLLAAAAEDPLEAILRIHERAPKILTSNRPADDCGKPRGDTGAVTALLNRLVHQPLVLTCGPRS